MSYRGWRQFSNESHSIPPNSVALCFFPAPPLSFHVPSVEPEKAAFDDGGGEDRKGATLSARSGEQMGLTTWIDYRSRRSHPLCWLWNTLSAECHRFYAWFFMSSWRKNVLSSPNRNEITIRLKMKVFIVHYIFHSSSYTLLRRCNFYPHLAMRRNSSLVVWEQVLLCTFDMCLASYCLCYLAG